MATPGATLNTTLEQWETTYQASRSQLTLQDLQVLRATLARIMEQVDRDAIGPSSSPVVEPPIDANS
jgi:hypothetical protein